MRRARSSAEVIKLWRDAVAQLEAKGEPFTVNQVQRLAGISWSSITRRPLLREETEAAIARVVAAIDPKIKPASIHELRCLKAIRALEAEGKPFRIADVCRLGGVCREYFRRNRKMRRLAMAAIARTEEREGVA